MRNFSKVCSTNFVGDGELHAVEIGVVACITHRCCRTMRATRAPTRARGGPTGLAALPPPSRPPEPAAHRRFKLYPSHAVLRPALPRGYCSY